MKNVQILNIIAFWIMNNSYKQSLFDLETTEYKRIILVLTKGFLPVSNNKLLIFLSSQIDLTSK